MATYTTENRPAPVNDRLAVWHQVLAVIMVIGILVQGFLASQGLFNNKPDWIDVHGMVGNILFLVALIQIVLGFISFRAGTMNATGLGLRVLLFVLVIVQIGLGYSTEDSPVAVAWHIPNGVLLMGVSTVIAVMSWPGNRRRVA